MNANDMLALIAEGLEVDQDTIALDTQIQDVDEWNSIGWLTIMSLADERLNVQIGSQDVRGFKTAGEVVDYLLQKAAPV